MRSENANLGTEMDGAGVSLDIPVRFAETDQMGVVHHSVFAVWLEAGRIAWLNAAGIPYTEIAARGYNFAVTGLSIEFRTPARFGDVVRVMTRLQRLRSRQILFGYEIRNAVDGNLLATGSSEHICVDESGQVTKIPADVLAQMRAGADAARSSGFSI